jgi:AraC family transcriptional regulator
MPSREKTIKDHKERINRVLLYIQENIAWPLSLETLSEVACFSPFHFHRLFLALVGETLSGYVRRVRLDRAALRLLHTKESVTTIALSAGYETPAAFAKAFRQHFGKTPSEYKRANISNGTRLKLQNLKASNKKLTTLKPEIRILPEQRVLFVRRMGRYDKAANEAWVELMKFANSRRLMGKETRFIGLSNDSPEITVEERLRYDACIMIDKDVMPEGEIGVQTIKGGRYAVFLHKGTYEKFGEIYNAIFSSWLQASDEKLRDAPCFEVYLNRAPRRTKPENLRTEIFVPIQ